MDNMGHVKGYAVENLDLIIVADHEYYIDPLLVSHAHQGPPWVQIASYPRVCFINSIQNTERHHGFTTNDHRHLNFIRTIKTVSVMVPSKW
jgi:hypothetical protein